MKDNVAEFLGAYNDLERALAEKLNYQGDKGMATYLNWGVKNQDPLILKYFEEIDGIREFRNVLTHESSSDIYPIAYPNEKLIDRMNQLVNKFSNHKTVGHLFLKEVSFMKDTDSLRYALKSINTLGYNQFPVFDKNKLIGILTENGITNYLAKKAGENHLIDIKGVTLKEVLEVDKGKNLYKIVDENTSIIEIEKDFEGQIKKGLQPL